VTAAWSTRFLLSERSIQRTGIFAAALGLIGMAALAVLAVCHGSAGIISAMTAVFFMATYGGLRRYQTERGLWMLAILIAVFGGCMWGLFVVADFVPRMRGTRPTPWPVALDASTATLLWGFSTRLAVSMGVHNWRRTSRMA
jgi:hypothetical protein